MPARSRQVVEKKMKGRWSMAGYERPCLESPVRPAKLEKNVAYVTILVLTKSVTCPFSSYSPPMRLSRFDVLKATTRGPWTRDFRHLLPVPKHYAMKISFYDPGVKVVRVKDRIKFWNVVPGDRVRIRGESSQTIHEVLSINKFSNRVYLKGTIRVCHTFMLLAGFSYAGRSQNTAKCL